MAALREGKRGEVRRAILLALLLAAAGTLALGGYLALLLFRRAEAAGDGAAAPLLLVAVMALVLGAFWVAFTLLDQHFDDLERLRGDLLVAGGSGGGRRIAETPRDAGAEVKRLAAAAFGLAGHRPGPTGDDLSAQLNARLAAILGATAEALIVVTDSGLVSLANAPAQRRFAAGRVAVGTSVFAALARDGLLEAQRQARAAQRPLRLELTTVEGEQLPACIADLGEHHGLVLCLPTSEPAAAPAGVPGLEHDLRLHDLVPPVEPVTAETPLAALSAVVLDCETTGLEVGRARIVSLGAVRLQGARLYAQANLDYLVRPGIPIPASATAIHGIGNALVANAPTIGELLPLITELVGKGAIVGHNIGYDLTVLANEAARSGVAWQAPPALDTALLMAVLEPEMTSLNLEDVAERLAVDLRGRHTALGDALMAAEIFLRLLPRLADRGVMTVGEAQKFAAGARRLRARQAAAGWRH